MKRYSQLLAIFVLICGLSACDDMSKADVGTITGGALGGVIGSQFGSGMGRAGATLAGTLIGAVIGNQIGTAMDERDRMMMSRALENTPSGKPYRWRNPDNGNSFTVIPERTMQRDTDEGYARPCRHYVQTAIIGGQAQKIEGTACRVCEPGRGCFWKVA